MGASPCSTADQDGVQDAAARLQRKDGLIAQEEEVHQLDHKFHLLNFFESPRRCVRWQVDGPHCLSHHPSFYA